MSELGVLDALPDGVVVADATGSVVQRKGRYPDSITPWRQDGTEISTDLAEVNESSWFARFNSRITLPGKIEWQTRLMYRGPQNSAQSDRNGMFMANLAFSKDILKDKASLVLNVSDLFNSRKRESTTYYGGRKNPSTISIGEFQWRERQVSLSFTYRFNQNKKRGKPQDGNQNGGGEGFEG